MAAGGDRVGLDAGPVRFGGGGHVRRVAAVRAGGDPGVQRAGIPGAGPKIGGAAARAIVCQTAKTPPQHLDLPFTTWSLSKLAEYLGQAKRIVISREAVHIILREAGIRWQTTKTWKTSRDPEFTTKMARILDLYDHPPAHGRVICVDEFGPLNLQPRPGRGWFPTGHPARLRATFHRNGGVRHMLAALDLASGQTFYRFRDRKRWQEFLGFCKQLRTRFPTGKLYLICDNYGPTRKIRSGRGARPIASNWCSPRPTPPG